MNPALWISKTGLDAQQRDISVISNNLANASTVGFKKSRAVFEDLLYQNINQPGGQSAQDVELPNGLMIGAGTKVVATQKSHTQGNVQTTDNSLDVMIDGKKVPLLVQTTKQSFAYVLNRETGEPVWPIEEREVPESMIPGEQTSPTQPFPTRPAAYEMQGVTIDDLIDFTPELRTAAIELMDDFQMGPLFNPPLHRDNDINKRAALICPGGNGGTNIPGGANVDPETGILYVASTKTCGAPFLAPGAEMDARDPNPTGLTVMEWASGPGRGPRGPEGLPILKPPYGRITAIDLNTGEQLWWIPNGDTPDQVKNHPALQGMEIPNTGQRAHATVLLTKTLLMYGEGRGAQARFHAVDKETGARVGTVDLPAPSNTAPMTYMHDGKQYIIQAVGGRGYTGSLVALALP